MPRPSDPALTDAVRDIVALSGPGRLDTEERWQLRRDAADQVGLQRQLVTATGELVATSEARHWDACAGLDRAAWEATRAWLSVRGASSFEVRITSSDRHLVAVGRLGEATAERLLAATKSPVALKWTFTGWVVGWAAAPAVPLETAKAYERACRNDFEVGPGVKAVSMLLHRWEREVRRRERAALSKRNAEHATYHRLTT